MEDVVIQRPAPLKEPTFFWSKCKDWRNVIFLGQHGGVTEHHRRTWHFQGITLGWAFYIPCSIHCFELSFARSLPTDRQDWCLVENQGH